MAACFSEEATYQFLVPHPPVAGRRAIETAFSMVLGECSEVKWEITTCAVDGDLVFLERIDCFWYGDREAAAECLGVFELEAGLIRAARDYADYGTWQQRKAAAQSPVSTR